MLFLTSSHVYVWRTPKETNNPECLVPTEKNGSVSVMIWAAMSWYSVGPIVTRNLRITASDYMYYTCSDNPLSIPVKSTVLPLPQNKKCRCVELIIYLCSECFQLSLRFPHSLMAWYLGTLSFIFITGLQHLYMSYYT